MPRSRPRRTRIRLLATQRAELQRRVAARTSSQQDAYRAEINPRVATGQTDAAIAQDMGLAVRTVFVWRHRFAEQRLDGLKDRPKCPPPRQYHADIQARLFDVNRFCRCMSIRVAAFGQRFGCPQALG